MNAQETLKMGHMLWTRIIRTQCSQYFFFVYWAPTKIIVFSLYSLYYQTNSNSTFCCCGFLVEHHSPAYIRLALAIQHLSRHPHHTQYQIPVERNGSWGFLIINLHYRQILYIFERELNSSQIISLYVCVDVELELENVKRESAFIISHSKLPLRRLIIIWPLINRWSSRRKIHICIPIF